MKQYIHTFGFGGGVQSVGALVLAARGKLPYRTFLFCHTGKDSENPATLDYLRDYATPYATAHGLDIIELRYTKRDGAQPTIREAIDAGRDIIPLYIAATRAKDPRRNGEPLKLSRTCTADWKARVAAKWHKDHGATPENPGVHGLGISLDEWERMKTHSGFAWQRIEYPLVDMRLTRQDLINIIERENLPVPPKSSCYFCPFHSVNAWRAMRDHQPELFAQAVELEAQINARRSEPAYLNRRLKPLAEAIDGEQLDLFDESCESGYCMV